MSDALSVIAMQTLAYADDLVLIAPSASGMRKMLSICDNYALDFHMSFSA